MSYLNPWDWGGRSPAGKQDSSVHCATLQERVRNIETDAKRHHDRLAELERWKGGVTLDLKTAELRWAEMDDKLDKIEGGVWWAVKLIIGGLIMGVIAFILSGGMKV